MGHRNTALRGSRIDRVAAGDLGRYGFMISMGGTSNSGISYGLGLAFSSGNGYAIASSARNVATSNSKGFMRGKTGLT